MLNVAQITSELARLPDNALQRYAMMHKDDPYVLSLAMSESNRRKEMRSGARMQAPQQPTVADQAVAQMAPLPEQVGIGALPAPNMQKMSDGGIAGYADGNLIAQNEPVVRMSGGGIVAFNGENDSLVQDEGPDNRSFIERLLYSNITPAEKARRAQLATAAEEARSVPTDAQRAADAAKAVIAQRNPNVTAETLQRLGIAPAPVQPDQQVIGKAQPAPAPVVKPPVEKPPKVAADTVTKTEPATVPALGLESLIGNIKKTLGTPDTVKSQEQFLKERAKYLGVDPTIAQGERLAKLEEKAAGDKNTALGNALMYAGLSMMAAKPVPGGKMANLFSAAGVGGTAGLKSLEESTKEIKAAEREREKLRSSIENAQYALKVGNLDAYDKYRKEFEDRNEKRNEHIAAAESHLSGIAMQGQTQREISAGTNATHLMAAKIAAAGHDPLALYRALGNGNVTAGYTMAKQDPIRSQMTEQWSKQAYPVTGMPNESFLKRYPTPETYIQEALTMQQSPGAAPTGGGKEPLIRSR